MKQSLCVRILLQCCFDFFRRLAHFVFGKGLRSFKENMIILLGDHSMVFSACNMKALAYKSPWKNAYDFVIAGCNFCYLTSAQTKAIKMHRRSGVFIVFPDFLYLWKKKENEKKKESYDKKYCVSQLCMALLLFLAATECR